MTDKNTPETVEIEDAQSEFVRIADLDGRDIVVFPRTIGKDKGDDGKPYDYLEADVIVLSGAPTDLMTEIPAVVSKMRFTSSPLVRNGERQIEKAGRLNLTYPKPFSGRVNSQKGKFGNKAYGVTAWDPDAPVRQLANAEAAKFVQARANAVTDDAGEFDE